MIFVDTKKVKERSTANATGLSIEAVGVCNDVLGQNVPQTKSTTTVT